MPNNLRLNELIISYVCAYYARIFCYSKQILFLHWSKHKCNVNKPHSIFCYNHIENQIMLSKIKEKDNLKIAVTYHLEKCLRDLMARRDTESGGSVAMVSGIGYWVQTI